MYEYLKRLHLSGALSVAGLDNAVSTYKWITTAQAGIIKGLKTKQDEAAAEAANPKPEPTPAPEPVEEPTES